MFFKTLMGEDNNIHTVSSLAYHWKRGREGGGQERKREGSCPKVEESKEHFSCLGRDRFRKEGTVNTSNAMEMTRMSSLYLVMRRSWLILRRQFYFKKSGPNG